MIQILKTFSLDFYAEESGKEPVRIWLKNLSRLEKKLIGEDIKTVQLGWPLGLPLVRPLGNGLWEIRSALDGKIARTFFIINAGSIVLLHGFIKKDQKIPLKEINLAKARAKNTLRSRG